MDYTGITVILLIALVASQAKIFGLLRTKKLREVMIFEMKIEDLLEDIIRETCVDRAVLCKIHNGGGRIAIGVDKKLSVICEPEASLIPHTKDTYKNFPIDKAYRSVLIDMLEANGLFTFQLTDRQPYGMLRRKTEADGITASMHFFIKETGTGVYFVFLATKDDPDEMIGHQKKVNLIEEKIQSIRNVCYSAARKGLLK